MTAPVQVYGQFSDHMSIPSVSRAICTELKRNHIKFTICGHGQIIPSYTDAPWPLALNSHAHVGIYIGYPPASPNWLKGHEKKFLITVCETNKIPNEWVSAANQMDYVFVPSKFCRQVFIDSGVRKSPVLVLPHGVTPSNAQYKRTPYDSWSNKTVELLHVTGAVSFPHRKGTPALLKAWTKLHKEFPYAQLTLKMYREPRLMKFIEALGLREDSSPNKDDGSIRIDDSPSLTPLQMARYLTRFDAVVQPSRGEGFGLCPLEARCLGIPTIITSISGHSEHFAPGVDIEVPVGPYKPLASQGNIDGFAPTVEVEHVEGALRSFLSDVGGHQERAQAWAARFGKMWEWKNVLKPLVNVVKPLAKKRGKTIRFSDSIGSSKEV